MIYAANSLCYLLHFCYEHDETIINKELVQQILSYGEDLTVLEPEEFRLKIKDRLVNNLNNYNECTSTA